MAESKNQNHPEAIVLNHVLLMAQQSLDPELYDNFVAVYNDLIEIRTLPNDKIQG